MEKKRGEKSLFIGLVLLWERTEKRRKLSFNQAKTQTTNSICRLIYLIQGLQRDPTPEPYIREYTQDREASAYPKYGRPSPKKPLPRHSLLLYPGTTL